MARSGVFLSFHQVSCALASAALIVALSSAPSNAQGIFDILFGGFKRLSATRAILLHRSKSKP